VWIDDWVWWFTAIIPATLGVEIGGFSLKASLGKSYLDIIFKNISGMVVHACNASYTGRGRGRKI
jgi:hypothetical protein